MHRSILLATLALAAALVGSSSAHARGGDYVLRGGTPAQRAQVHAALRASAFDWSLVPAHVTIEIQPGQASRAMPSRIWLDGDLLDAGIFSWAIVQHEYAHQVDFFRLDDELRGRLGGLLRARSCWYGTVAAEHHESGSERFASTLAWAYWPSAQNALKPRSAADEAAGMPAQKFRSLMRELIGMPDTLSRSKAASQARPSRAPGRRRG
jgi:hypothetical protein